MKRCGFQVSLVAGFAPEAVQVASALRPDAVVVDLALSGDLGLQMLPAFRRVSPACMTPSTPAADTPTQSSGFLQLPSEWVSVEYADNR